MAGSLLPQPKQTFYSAAGLPLIGGKLYTYAAGSLTPKATYQDAAQTIANTNPAVTNARGEVVMYGSGAYRVILKDAFGTLIWDRDNIEAPTSNADSSQMISSSVAAYSASLAAGGGAGLVGFRQSDTEAARTLQAKLRETVSPEDVGAAGDGVTDDTAALQKWLNQGGNLQLTRGKTYRMTAKVSSAVDGVSIDGSGACILTDFPVSSVDGAFHFEGAGYIGDAVTATAGLSFSGTALPVSNASGFSVGDYIEITSTEYFNGIDGFSGYGVKTKGELNQVRSVSGNTITVLEAFKDDYSLTGETITVRRISVVKNVGIRNVRFRNTSGGAGGHTTDNPTGARAIIPSRAYNLTIDGCIFENFPRFSIEAKRCKGVVCTNNQFLGYDITDATNQPAGSEWFTGATFTSCEDVTFDSNIGRNIRRHFDADTSSAGPVARNMVVSNNVAINCVATVGTHACDNITIIGNSGVNSGGINFRGKNVTISGNSMYFGASGSIGISMGHTKDAATSYAEQTSLGRVIVSNNRLRGKRDIGIKISADVDSLVISGNDITSTISNCILVGGKRTQNVVITGNILENNRGGGIAIHIPNFSAIPRQLLKSVVISKNILKTSSNALIIISGASVEAPADEIVIVDNICSGATARSIGLLQSGDGDVVGRYGRSIAINGNVFQGPTPTQGDIQTARLGAAQAFIGENVWSSVSACLVQTNAAYLSSDARSYEVGMQRRNSTPTASGYIGQVCVTAGTGGTLSGVTGGIAAGSNLLTVSDVTNIQVGTYLTVAGAGLTASARVVSVSGLTCTLTEDAAFSVSSAAVTYTAPVWKSYGAIAA